MDTRKILISSGEKNESKNVVYYIPGYFRIKVKNFTLMNLDNLTAQMNASLIFTIYYGDLNPLIVKELMTGIVLLFGRDNAIELKKEL